MKALKVSKTSFVLTEFLILIQLEMREKIKDKGYEIAQFREHFSL
jgi:hypothetical protein